MWKENLYQPVEILLREHDTFPIGEHQHSFFEMAYILEGTGSFVVNSVNGGEEHHNYCAADLCLIPPNRVHLFRTCSHSRYLFIRFTENYVTDYINRNAEGALDIQAGYCIRFQQSDAEMLHSLIGLIVREVSEKKMMSDYLLNCYVNSVIVLAVRNLSTLAPEHDNADSSKAQYMLKYIRQHIHQPELLKLNIVAEKFHLSPTYAGRFFKRNFGEDFKQYIQKSRLKTVEDMLVGTQMSIKEISNRMGYTDPCYLNKLFQQYHNMTPLQYRKKYCGTHLPISEEK